MNPEQPLTWPNHYPPKTRWKRFFIGVRWLGPDLSFFAEFRNRQATRTHECMRRWSDDLSRRLALIIGESITANVAGWKQPYFLPEDDFGVILNGPKFSAIDDLGTDGAISEIERRVGRDFADEFWERASTQTLRDVVREMLEHGAAA